MKHKTTCALAATGVITMGSSVWPEITMIIMVMLLVKIVDFLTGNL